VTITPDPNSAPEPAPDKDAAAEDGQRTSVGRILKHSSIYSLVPLLQQVLALSLVRLYTRELGDSEWGALTLSELVILLVPQLVGVNLLGGMTRFYFEQKKQRDRNTIISSTFLALTAMSWVVCGIALLARVPLAGLLFGSEGAAAVDPIYVDYWILTLLIIPFSLSARLAVDYMVILEKPGLTTAVRLFKSLGVIGLNIWFLVGLDWGLRGYLAGILIGEAVISTGFTIYLMTRLGMRYSSALFTPMLRFALPLLPVGLLQLGLHQLDRYLVKANVPLGGLDGMLEPGTDEALTWTGIYGLGYKIGSLVHVALLGSFMQVWQPLIFGMKDDRARRETMVRVGTYAMISLAAVYLPVALFGRQLVDLLSGKPFYRLAYEVAPWATISYLFYGAYAISQAALFQAKKSRPLIWINASALALNVALNLYLVPRMGIVGAAIATLCSFLLLAVLGGFSAHKHYGLSFRGSSVLQLFALAMACLGVTRMLDEWMDPVGLTELAQVIAVKAAVALAILYYLWARVLDANGRAGLVRLVRSRLPSR
jgi:O-antigen/teichoic acid export membrane protein